MKAKEKCREIEVIGERVAAMLQLSPDALADVILAGFFDIYSYPHIAVIEANEGNAENRR